MLRQIFLVYLNGFTWLNSENLCNFQMM